MTLPEYEYKGLIAEAWDILRGDTSGWADRFFYLDLIRQHGQPVLDVGCGTGRLLIDYLQQGIEIDGIDNSPDMLALCRQKAQALGLETNLYEQYLETLSLPRHYQTILIPSSSLQLITEPDMARQALAKTYDHLLPGGVVAASIMTLWQLGDPLTSEMERTAVRTQDGATFRRVARARYNPDSECEDTEDHYQLIDKDGRLLAEEHHHRSPATRSYTQTQARALFQNAGFNPVTLYSEFTTDPAKPEDTLFTIVAQKP